MWLCFLSENTASHEVPGVPGTCLWHLSSTPDLASNPGLGALRGMGSCTNDD